MKKTEVIIDKDNYKGYVELYRTFYMSEKEDKIIKNMIVRLVVFGTISVATILLTKDIISFGVLFLSSTIINLGYGITESIKESKKRKQLVKQNYPYVDLSIDKGELERALKKEKILTSEVVENIVCFKLDVESYEKRLVEDEIKKLDQQLEDNIVFQAARERIHNNTHMNNDIILDNCNVQSLIDGKQQLSLTDEEQVFTKKLVKK